MDYKKAYNEALERAKKVLLDCTSEERKAVEYAFPELREDDDERIRKELISLVRMYVSPKATCLVRGGSVTRAQAESYLEKQKEQKSEESILRLIVKGKGVYKICPHCKSRMIRDDSKVYTSQPPQYGYNCPKCGTIEYDTVMYDSPETEEQHPAEWNFPSGVNETVDKLIAIAECLEMDGNCLFNGHTGTESGKFLRDLARKQVECKPAEWSEEDEDAINGAIGILLEDYLPNEIVGTCTTLSVGEITKRLKSLGPQPHWKPSEQEMNAFETALKGEFQNCAYPASTLCKLFGELKKLYYNDEIPPHWKPSDEQMDALKEASASWMNREMGNCELLESLYNDLKKL